MSATMHSDPVISGIDPFSAVFSAWDADGVADDFERIGDRQVVDSVELAARNEFLDQALRFCLKIFAQPPDGWARQHPIHRAPCDIMERRISLKNDARGTPSLCVGQMLARLEAELLFAALTRRVASFGLAGEPVRRPNNTLRGFATLPIRVRRTCE